MLLQREVYFALPSFRQPGFQHCCGVGSLPRVVGGRPGVLVVEWQQWDSTESGENGSNAFNHRSPCKT